MSRYGRQVGRWLRHVEPFLAIYRWARYYDLTAGLLAAIRDREESSLTIYRIIRGYT